jgi:hypothetical protein
MFLRIAHNSLVGSYFGHGPQGSSHKTQEKTPSQGSASGPGNEPVISGIRCKLLATHRDVLSVKYLLHLAQLPGDINGSNRGSGFLQFRFL